MKARGRQAKPIEFRLRVRWPTVALIATRSAFFSTGFVFLIRWLAGPELDWGAMLNGGVGIALILTFGICLSISDRIERRERAAIVPFPLESKAITSDRHIAPTQTPPAA